MRFNWINGVNFAFVAYLIAVNIIAARKGLCGDFCSRRAVVNALEQLGRYGCMALMVLPILARGWEFGFASVTAMLVWFFASALILAAYTLLWFIQSRAGRPALYGLAILPAALFLLSGVLLGHPLLIVFSLIFGAAHFAVTREKA